MRPATSLLPLSLCALCSLPALAAKPTPATPSAEPASREPAPPAQVPATPPDEQEEEEELPPIPPAADSLGGHLVVSASGGLSWPFGELQEGIDGSDVMGRGYVFDLELAYGVSRTVAAGAWGRFGGFGSTDSCSGCSSSSYGFGALVRYHLVQGVRFDPWLSAGFGLTGTTVEAGSDKLDYFGLELVRLRLGGDWYPFGNLGIGPFLGLDTDLYLDRPEDLDALGRPDAEDSSALSYTFVLGARIVFDSPGK